MWVVQIWTKGGWTEYERCETFRAALHMRDTAWRGGFAAQIVPAEEGR
jgi:hypothetical protein